MTDSTQISNLPNADAPNQGDVKTAVLDNLAGQTQLSGGESVSTQTPAPAADVTGQPEGDKLQPDDTGKISRLEQRLAQNNKILTSLGIDPESDIAERYQRGLVSKEELLMRAGIQAPQPQMDRQAARPVSAMDKLYHLKQRVGQSVKDNKGILEADILEFMDVASDLAGENVQLQQQGEMAKNLNDCRSATLSVIEKDNVHTELPDNIKEIESELFLSSTDYLLSVNAGGNIKYYTPSNYQFYAGKNLQRLNNYRNYLIDLGRKTPLPPPPKPNTARVNPISSSTGSAPITPPETLTTIHNMGERARAYVENFGVV